MTDLHPLIHWKIVKSPGSHATTGSRSILPQPGCTRPGSAQFTMEFKGLNNVEAAEMLALMVRRNIMRVTRAADVITPDVRGTQHTTMISEKLADVEDGFWADTEHPALR